LNFPLADEVDVIEAMEEGEDVQLKVAVMWDGNDYYKPYKYIYM
jgi:hypothetical protein